MDQLYMHTKRESAHYIISELISGVSINAKIFQEKQENMNIDAAVSAVKNLQKIHEKNILHLDIKGENIIFNSKDNTSTIIDFGVSMSFDEMEKLNELVVVGTPGYMPIEMFGCCNNFNLANMAKEDYPALDIYSLGNTFHKDLNLSDLDIVYKMMEPNYQDRPKLAEVLSALEEFKKNKPIIIELENNILNTEDIGNKIKMINQLYQDYKICSSSYYDVLKQVLREGTNEEQLISLLSNPKFAHLFLNGFDSPMVLKNRFSKDIQELRNCCLSNIKHGNLFYKQIVNHVTRLYENKNIHDMLYEFIKQKLLSENVLSFKKKYVESESKTLDDKDGKKEKRF